MRNEKLLAKTIETIQRAPKILRSSYAAACGCVDVYRIGEMTLERYNGGFKVMYQGETLFHTHTSANTNEYGTADIQAALDSKLDAKRADVESSFLNS